MERTLGHTLKFARIKLGLTQYQLAKKIDVAPSTIGMYEQDRRTPDYSILLRLCTTLKISLYDFFYKNEIFNADIVLDYIMRYLGTEKPVAWGGKVLDKEKKDNIAYVLKLLLNEKCEVNG